MLSTLTFLIKTLLSNPIVPAFNDLKGTIIPIPKFSSEVPGFY